MKKDQQPGSYEEAWNELQQIVSELQAETISIDELSEKIKRASLLTNYCREKLRQTEADLEQFTKE